MLLADRLAVRRSPALRLPSMPAGPAVFSLAAAAYLALAAILTFGFHVVSAQAMGIVANASYVLFSRDPHVAAIGFVGSPLPSLLTLPLLPLRGIWPALTEVGFAACIVSALFMAAAVYQLHQMLREGGVGRIPRLALSLIFAVHPLVIFAAASGAAEASYVFFLLLAARHLARWLRDGNTVGAMVAGFALAGAYLARYDAALAGVTAVLLVGVISFRRAPDRRLATGFCDALIVGLPLAATAGLWAAAAWLVTGNAFPQLASSYGYLAQLDALRAHSATPGSAVSSPQQSIVQVLALEPALIAAAVILLVSWLRGRSRASLAGLGLLGPLVLAIVAAGLAGWTFPWLRQFIVVVPLVTLLVGLGLVSGRRSWVAPVAACLMLLVALPTTVGAMWTARLGQEEMPVLRTIAGRPTTGTTSASVLPERVAQYLDGQHLKDGSVLIDSFTGFPVILASKAPHQFLITSDRDFGLALGSPRAFGVQYLLVPSPTDQNVLGSLDALNKAYPSLFQSGSASGALVREFLGPGKRPLWRLYQVSAIENQLRPNGA